MVLELEFDKEYDLEMYQDVEKNRWWIFLIDQYPDGIIYINELE